MTDHKTGTREEWLAARLELLEAEKALTRRSDELARWRQELPWVRIDKEYRFETDEGAESLADLFRGRSQLLIYHFMFGAEYTADGLELPLGVFVRQRLQLRLPGGGHQGAVGVGNRRVQLPQGGLPAASRSGQFRARRVRIEHRRNELGDVQARRPRGERVHARGRRRTSHLLGFVGRPLGERLLRSQAARATRSTLSILAPSPFSRRITVCRDSPARSATWAAVSRRSPAWLRDAGGHTAPQRRLFRRAY
jgi:hypothetical protein